MLWREEHLLELLRDEQGFMSLVPYILLAWIKDRQADIHFNETLMHQVQNGVNRVPSYYGILSMRRRTL